MFKFLKDKLKQSINKLSDDIDKEGTEEVIQEEEVVKEEKKKEGFFSKLFKRKKEEPIEDEYEESTDEDLNSEKTSKDEEKPKSVEDLDTPELFDEKTVSKTISDEYDSVSKPKTKSITKVKPKTESKKPEDKDSKISKPKKDSYVENDNFVTTENYVEKEKPQTAEEILEEIKVKDSVKEIKKDITLAKKKIHDAEVIHDKGHLDSATKELKKVSEKSKDLLEKVDNAAAKKDLVEKISLIKKDIKEIETLEPEEEKTGFFGRLKQKIVTKKISDKQFEELFWDLELVLLENNVAVEVIEKIKSDLKELLVDRPIRRGKIEETITSSLRASVESLFDVESIDLLKKVKEKKPFVLCLIGVNGSGKTTTIAKLVHYFKKNNLRCVIAAADTFRAAAIQQLEEHAKRLDVKMIKHDYGADAAAVAFDAVKYAEAHHIDVVLIDTAGRLHSNINLIDEMKKIVRVAKPDMNVFIGESITGNDCVEQAQKFNEAVGIDFIVLSKADVDEKGGAAISVSYVTKKPIIFLGTGQGYDDLKPFDSSVLIESLGL